MVNVVAHRRTAFRRVALALAGVLAAGAVAAVAPASAQSLAAPPGATAVAAGRPLPPAPSTSVGSGGAVSSVDAEASAIGLEVLRDGGNAADAAVATAAALGVTEPYSAGIGGGGYFVYFDAATGEVTTIDGRETAPLGMTTGFTDPATGLPYSFSNAVSSGLSVGVPGTLATWEAALDRFGTESLRDMLKPATLLATKGFTVDATFRLQTSENEARFRAFPDTAELFLPGGELPEVGSVFKNLDLARTLRLIALRGTDAFYEGELAAEMADIVQEPRIDRSVSSLPAPPGHLTTDDLAAYEVIEQAPTHVQYRGLDVYGIAPSSSGGTTVGESLNILENHDLASAEVGQALHLYFEATARAFADRNAYVGDPAYVDVPTEIAAQPGVRRRARLHDRSAPGFAEAGAAGRARRARMRRRGARRGRGHREPLDDPPLGRRPMGQRGRLHAHDRVDRRFGDDRARPRLPAEQRADRLQLHAHEPDRPEPRRARQASRARRCRPRSCSTAATCGTCSARPAARPSSRRSCRSS